MAVIGSVEVEVVPSSRNFAQRLRTDLEPLMAREGQVLGAKLGESFGAEARKKLEASLTNIKATINVGVDTAGVRAKGQQSGAEFADAFSRTVDARVSAAFKALPDLKPGVNLTEADKKLAEIKASLLGLGDERLSVLVDDKTSLAVIAGLRTDLEKLTGPEHDVRVRVNAAAAVAELRAVQAEVDKLDEKQTKAGDDGEKSSKKFSLGLIGAAAAVSTGLIPVAAAATGIGVALAAAGGIGLLAFKGIGVEMQAQTDLGLAYTAQVNILKTALSGLEHTAAAGFLPATQQGVAVLRQFLPEINSQVRQFSGLLGTAGVSLEHGLLAGFVQFRPLILDVIGYVGRLAGSFDRAASGGGLAKFIDYARSALPQVEQVLGNVVSAVTKLLVAGAGTGSGVLTAIGLLATAINAIPIGVLRVLVPLLTAGFAAFKAYTGVAVIIAGVTTALEGYATASLIAGGASKALAAETTSASLGMSLVGTKLGGLTGSLGIAGVAAGGLLLGFRALTNVIADSPASADAAAAGVKKIGQAGQVSSGQLKAFGDSGKNLGSVFENAFHESTLTKIKDFDFGFSHLGIGINSATRDSQNFFKSTDSGLNSLVKSGDIGGAANAFAALAKQAKAHGVSVDQLLSKLPQYKSDMDALKGTVAGNTAAQAALGGVLRTNAQSYTDTADNLGLNVKAVTKYSELLGITKENVTSGALTQVAFNTAVANVAHAYATANTATSGYLTALEKFSTSAGAASDKASLIGATLKASQGDLLDYSKQMVTAADANASLVKSFDKAQHATVNWKTGLIDFHNSASGPLIDNLSKLQTAAEGAATATYQHEVALRGAKQAASDAADVFKNDTYNALIKDAGQLGITGAQAKLLAEQYFHMPKNIKTQVEAIGLNTVNDTLNELGKQLAYISGHPWVPIVGAKDNASAPVAKVKAALGGLQGKNVPVGAIVAGALTNLFAVKQSVANVPPHADVTARAFINAGRDQVRVFQGSVDSLHGKTVPANADTAAGRGNLSFFQGIVDALHGKTVDINVNTGQAAAQVGAIAYQINGLHDRTINITSVNRTTGAVGTVRAAFASGGPVFGAGTGTSDSIPALLSNGEYVINSAATKVFRPLLDLVNYGSRKLAAPAFAMDGLPAFETGGFVGVPPSKYIGGGNSTKARRARAARQARGAKGRFAKQAAASAARARAHAAHAAAHAAAARAHAARSAASAAAAHRHSSAAAKNLAAANAAVVRAAAVVARTHGHSASANRALASARRHAAAAAKSAAATAAAAAAFANRRVNFVLEIAGGAVTGIVQQVKVGTPVAAAAMRDLSIAMAEAFSLRGVEVKLRNAYGNLALLQQYSTQLSSAVTTNLRSQFNTTTAGAASTGYVSGVGAIHRAFSQQTAGADKFTAEIRKLSKAGLDRAYLLELERAGPSQTLDVLAKSSGRDIAAVNADYARYQGATARAGSVAATDRYAPFFAKQTQIVDSGLRESAALRAEIRRYVQATANLEHRPIVLQIDHVQFARAVEQAQSRYGRGR